RSAFHLLHRAGQVAEDAFSAEVDDLTPRQLAVLVAVSHSEGLSQAALVDRTGVGPLDNYRYCAALAEEGTIAAPPYNARRACLRIDAYRRRPPPAAQGRADR